MTALPINEIVCGDCLEVMREWPDNSFDVIVTDFPYGVGWAYDQYDDTQENLRGLIAGAMPEILRLAPVAVVTTGVLNMHAYPVPDWTMAWFSATGTRCGPWGFSCWQPILCYGKDPYLARGLGRRPDAFLRRGLGLVSDMVASNKAHPCAKPIGVWSWLLARVMPEAGMTVLDPFVGSGTTCVAAKMQGFDYVGIELSPDYCEIARNRVANTERNLFAETP